MTIVPLILAAGESKRMGTPKALLDFDGRSALDLILRTCGRTGAAAPLVILGADADRIRPVVPAGVAVAVNTDYASGQTSSLKIGLRALPPGADGFLLYPVDLPLVRSDTIDRILAAPGPIAVPVYGGRRGHPVRFERSLITEILALADHEPVHGIVRRDRSRVTEITVDDPAVVARMNTPEEYRNRLRAFREANRAGGPA